MPEAYEYRICEFVEVIPKLESAGEENKQVPSYNQFEATIRLKLKTKTEARAWIKAMEKTSAVTWRVDKTYPVCGGKKTQNVYRVSFSYKVPALAQLKQYLSTFTSQHTIPTQHYFFWMVREGLAHFVIE